MARTSYSRESPETLTATLRLREQDHTFRLYCRPLRLGDSGTVQYYWMDSSQFRNPTTAASSGSFRGVIAYWLAALENAQGCLDAQQYGQYTAAVCYGLFGRCKSIQSAYRDAHLAPKSISIETMSLPDDVRQQIHAVIQSRDRFEVQKELDATLGRLEPPKVLPLMQTAYLHWINKGINLVRHRGQDGLLHFLKEVDLWSATYRRRGGNPWVRLFLNMFAYECKIAFYSCYAALWTGLIPWLREHRKLDDLSERFLRFWHNQGQPIPVPHGQTVGGILYPTRHNVAVIEPDRGSYRLLRMTTEHIGPTHVRDVFNGQILSLHPLSGFLMKDPALCAIAGRFFASEDYHFALARCQAPLCQSYWDLIGALLAAAHMYRQALDRQAAMRGKLERNSLDTLDCNPTDPNQHILLEELVQSLKLPCSHCGTELRFQGTERVDPDKVAMALGCPSCGRNMSGSLTRADLEHRLLPMS